MLGQPVTLETFLAWKEKFEAEKLAMSGKKSSDVNDDRPTGLTVARFLCIDVISFIVIIGKQLFLMKGETMEEGEDLILAGEAEEINIDSIDLDRGDDDECEEGEEEDDDDDDEDWENVEVGDSST
jgi:hypothetical protein